MPPAESAEPPPGSAAQRCAAGCASAWLWPHPASGSGQQPASTSRPDRRQAQCSSSRAQQPILVPLEKAPMRPSAHSSHDQNLCNIACLILLLMKCIQQVLLATCQIVMPCSVPISQDGLFLQLEVLYARHSYLMSNEDDFNGSDQDLRTDVPELWALPVISRRPPSERPLQLRNHQQMVCEQEPQLAPENSAAACQ